MKEEKWKTLIRQKLQDYEETPPPELWNDLMKALPQPEQQRPATVRTRRRWLYGIETALGAAAALTALFWVFRYPTTVPPRASHTVVEHKQPQESPTQPHAQTADFRSRDTEKRLIAFSVNTPSQAAATTAGTRKGRLHRPGEHRAENPPASTLGCHTPQNSFICSRKNRRILPPHVPEALGSGSLCRRKQF